MSDTDIQRASDRSEEGITAADRATVAFAASPEAQMLLEGIFAFFQIPKVGAYLSKRLTTRAAEISSEYTTDFREAFAERIRLLETHSIRRDFLESDDFLHFFLQNLARARSTRKREKRRRFGRLTASSLFFGIDYDGLEELGSFHDALTDAEFAVSFLFYQHELGELPRAPIIRAHELPEEFQGLGIEIQRIEGLRPLAEMTGIPHDRIRGVIYRAIQKGALYDTMDAELAESQQPTHEFRELCGLLTGEPT